MRHYLLTDTRPAVRTHGHETTHNCQQDFLASASDEASDQRIGLVPGLMVSRKASGRSCVHGDCCNIDQTIWVERG
jgi:hypothetical protein